MITPAEIWEGVEFSRVSQVARALHAVGEPEALAIVRALRSRPLESAEVARAVKGDLGETEELLRELADAGVVVIYTKGAWWLSPLGAELWTLISPLLRVV